MLGNFSLFCFFSFQYCIVFCFAFCASLNFMHSCSHVLQVPVFRGAPFVFFYLYRTCITQTNYIIVRNNYFRLDLQLLSVTA